MNWRIDMAYQEVKDLVFQGQLNTLLSEDQLIKNIKTDPTLQRFSEGHITFNPTYKYDDNSETYDTSKKMRVPSWTDRVLYQASRGPTQVGEIRNSIKLDFYHRRESRYSDHRPVLAQFKVLVKKVDKEKRAAIERE